MVSHDLVKAPGLVVRVSVSHYRGKDRLDVREYFEARTADPASLAPTKKGVSILLEDLPRLRAALEAVEAEAIAAGQLLPEDYENAGLAVPLALLAVS